MGRVHGQVEAKAADAKKQDGECGRECGELRMAYDFLCGIWRLPGSQLGDKLGKGAL